MTRSSPLKSELLSSPDRGNHLSFLFEERNTELSHRDALAAAQAEHQRVRDAALRVYELHELREEHQRILDQGRREEERLKAEARVAEEVKRLQILKAKTIPKPAPPPPPQPAPAAPKPVERVQPPGAVAKPPETTTPDTTAPKSSEVKAQLFAATPVANGFPSAPPKPASNNAFPPTATPAAPFGLAAPKPAAAVVQKPKPVQAQTQPAPPSNTTIDRYRQIHQELKTLRKNLTAQSKVPGSPLKGKMGTFRREIRVAIGQLTGGKGANVQPTNKIMSILRESLEGKVPSPPIDVSTFVLEPRQPAEGALFNDATMPALFVYLVNICAKGIISQFINEAGANPKAADPIGVFAAQIFSHKDFQWRGQSLIDILLAKYRVACPVLFGFRGNDKTERGRQAIGWRKDGPTWITEQNHNDRMAGLGAGFASISLRDFSKSSKVNPYPPTNYWKAFAGIVNSPANETSNTQYVVLRTMIDGHEQRFLNFFGNAAAAALRMALVEFPRKAPPNASAAGSLLALAEVLKSESGLVFT